MNILVTGGLGVNGAWVTRQLLEEDHRPIVYENRLDTTLVSDIAGKLDIVLGDIMDLAGVIRVLKQYKIKLIAHLAALMPGAAQENPFVGFRVNALGTVNILEAARIMDVERVIFTSSKGAFAPIVGEYGYPAYKPLDENYPLYPTGFTAVYGSGKIASELMGINYSNNYGLQFIALRFATIYGVGKTTRHGSIAIHSLMIENAMSGRPTSIPVGGDEKDDMLYAKDCANSIVLACFAKNVKNHIFNIGTGKGYTLHDLAKSIQKIYPQAKFDIGPGLDYMEGPGAYSVMNIARAKAELGYTPKFSLDKGIADYIASMKLLKLNPV
jgi:UDP-glucose 4-epimerase